MNFGRIINYIGRDNPQHKCPAGAMVTYRPAYVLFRITGVYLAETYLGIITAFFFAGGSSRDA